MIEKKIYVPIEIRKAERPPEVVIKPVNPYLKPEQPCYDPICHKKNLEIIFENMKRLMTGVGLRDDVIDRYERSIEGEHE